MSILTFFNCSIFSKSLFVVVIKSPKTWMEISIIPNHFLKWVPRNRYCQVHWINFRRRQLLEIISIYKHVTVDNNSNNSISRSGVILSLGTSASDFVALVKSRRRTSETCEVQSPMWWHGLLRTSSPKGLVQGNHKLSSPKGGNHKWRKDNTQNVSIIILLKLREMLKIGRTVRISWTF
jgi:hypothetical protein